MMRLFSCRSGEPGHVPESSKSRALRMVLLVCVFGAVFWGFWGNSQRRLEELGRRSVLYDETGELTKADKEVLFARARVFQSVYGLRLNVRVHTKASSLREATHHDIFLDIAPARGEVIVTLPPLLQRAAGERAIRDVEDAFLPYFAAGTWQKGLPAALDRLQTVMSEVFR